MLLLRTDKFYKRLYLKSGLLHDVFWSFMIFKRDECMRTVFIPLHKAISNLLCQFYDYVYAVMFNFVSICIYLHFSVCFCLIDE